MDRWHRRRGGDVNRLLSCVRTYLMFLYCCCHYKHTKLASRQMDIIWTKDGTGCWQMAPVQQSVIHIRIHTPLITLTAFHLDFTVNPLTSSPEKAEWKLPHSLNSASITLTSSCKSQLLTSAQNETEINHVFTSPSALRARLCLALCKIPHPLRSFFSLVSTLSFSTSP